MLILLLFGAYRSSMMDMMVKQISMACHKGLQLANARYWLVVLKATASLEADVFEH